MHDLLAKIWLLPVALAVLCEVRASYLVSRIQSNHNIILRRNLLGRVSFESLRIYHQSISEPNVKAGLKHIINVKRWLFIWLFLGMGLYLFLHQEILLNLIR